MALVALAFGGCAISPDRKDQIALQTQPPIELSQTPFFPQEEYQCGPAALVTVLNTSGVAVTPRAVSPQVYLPEQRGSLQSELIGAARRHNRIPYLIEPSLRALLDELNAQRPVLVFQNLGIKAWPAWHFAVVVGYDPASDEWVLRSGTTERKRQSTSLFLRTWQRGERWAMVVLRPGELPADDRPKHYLQAVANFEQVASDAQQEAVEKAYSAALTRWPDNGLVHFAIANHAYETGQAAEANRHYRQAVRLEPHHGVIRNNYALLLAEHGCIDAARQQIEAALKTTDSASPLHERLQHTSDDLGTDRKRSQNCSFQTDRVDW